MYYATIDARDGGSSSSNVCNKCCCEPIGMRPGETNLVTLNYAPWSVPLGGRGLLPNPIVEITTDSSGCQSQVIDGFANPDMINPDIAVAQPAGLATWNPADNVTPAGNAFTFAIEPVSGPSYGSVVAAPADGMAWNVQFNTGFVGYDSMWIRATDAQGRSVVREQVFVVGGPTTPKPYAMGKNGLVIDRSKIEVNPRAHTVSIPLYLAPGAACDTVDGCKKYRVTIKQAADDCYTIFNNISCLDVFCQRC